MCSHLLSKGRQGLLAGEPRSQFRCKARGREGAASGALGEVTLGQFCRFCRNFFLRT